MTSAALQSAPREARFVLPADSLSAPRIDPATYAAFDGQKLIGDAPNDSVPTQTQFVHSSFRALVQNPQFACVAAKSAFNKNNYRFGLFDGELGSASTTENLSQSLCRFVEEQDETLRENGFSTFVASFTGPLVFDEIQFEALLWKQLQLLHEGDTSAWDKSVSRDVDQADFAWSFGGRAFFVVGLHPAASRLTRRFAFPTLVFNSHFQFEELRASGKFPTMQTAIRSRDMKLQGSLNPNLSDFGDRSDARQYSGRAVEEEWKCPFHAIRRAAEKETV